MNKRILMVYPEIPATYWSFKHALDFVGYKSLMPPLGLITIAAMLPDSFDVKLIDMNIEELVPTDIEEADLVFISAMIVQKDSFHKAVTMCNQYGTPVVAGGPYPTTGYQNIDGVDHFILNEGEVTLPRFLADYKAGYPQKIYMDETKPDITQTPVPRFDLLKMELYSTMSIQSSRGCPFNCEFCDIIEMFGRVPRYKTPQQFIKEMDYLYQIGYRGPLFIVDDNFIGNKRKVRELLTHIAHWQKERNYPYTLFTEASINLAQDDHLMDLMVDAGLDMIFIGIETPVSETLEKTQKQQNVRIDIMESVMKIQRTGIEVMAGFIVGFDSDPENIFDLQIDFIQKAGIPMAMIGTLIALPNTQLYRRLEKEGRIIGDTNGNNTHNVEINFIPRMDIEKLEKGYKKIISTIYEPKNYFRRSMVLVKRLPRNRTYGKPLELRDIRAFLLSLARQAFSRYGLHYLKLLAQAMIYNRSNFPLAVNLAIKGHHFFKITSDILKTDDFKNYIETSLNNLEESLKELSRENTMTHPRNIEKISNKVKRDLSRRYMKLTSDLKLELKDNYNNASMRADILTYRWILNSIQNRIASQQEMSLGEF